MTHLIVVVVDYFMKWVEERPLATLTIKKIEDFVFPSIIYQYGISNKIIAHNGSQFNYKDFRSFCQSYGIQLQFVFVHHLKANYQVKSINKVLLEGIKLRLEEKKGRWVDKLNNIFQSYKMISQTTIGVTPFHWTFGTEVVILVEISVLCFKVTILLVKKTMMLNFVIILIS